MVEEEEKFGVVEWVIENFTCFCKELHGEDIESPIFNYTSRMVLTPQGPDDLMEVQIRNINGAKKHRGTAPGGVLTFLGSDGYPLHTRHMEDGTQLEPPPSFEDVVALIRARESSHPDRFTIRYKFQSKRNFVESMCTLIEMVDTNFSLDVNVTLGSMRISDVEFSGSRLPSRMHLSSVRMGNNQELTLEPSNFKRFCLVQCYINLVQRNEGCKIKEHLFRDETPWVIADSQEMGEEKSIPVLLRLKIVTGTITKKYFRRLNDYKETEVVDISGCSEASSAAVPNVSVTEDSPVKGSPDILLRCGSVTFATHRNVLSAWSPVFERLLSTDMREVASGMIEISDLDPPTLARFLAFLHTATVDDVNSESAIKLYYAADKYDIKTLKNECCDYLVKNVATSNVCDVLMLGTKHSDEELVSVAQNFILNNFNEVLVSKEWRAFKSTEPLLAVNTITSFAEKNCLGKINPV